MLAKVKDNWKLYKLSNFPHRVSEPFELEGCDLRDSLEKESLSGVGTYFAVFAEVFVIALEFVDGEEAVDTLWESIGSLAFLIYPDWVQC